MGSHILLVFEVDVDIRLRTAAHAQHVNMSNMHMDMDMYMDMLHTNAGSRKVANDAQGPESPEGAQTKENQNNDKKKGGGRRREKKTPSEASQSRRPERGTSQCRRLRPSRSPINPNP